jgi:hypothetical protein
MGSILSNTLFELTKQNITSNYHEVFIKQYTISTIVYINEVLSLLPNISINYFERGPPTDFLFENTGILSLF